MILPAVFSDTKPGKGWASVFAASVSSATIAPMFGAILPVALVGLRAI
jgi:hypothetical protein